MKKFSISWTKLIVFAVIAGIYTGVAALIPAFKDTSFQDISISFEWWILFGIVIILGSKSNKDAALKCFVFFLISQPLVYLTQIIFGGASWGIFSYYKNWILWTVLTLPMGFIGYYLKKDRWWGLLIMAPIWLFLGWHLNGFMGEAISFFPNHLFSAIFCVATMFLYVFWIFRHKLERWIGAAFCSLIILACVVFNCCRGSFSYNTTIMCNSDDILIDENSSVSIEQYGTLEITEVDFGSSVDYCINASFNKTGTTTFVIKNSDTVQTFNIRIERNTFSIEEIK